MVFVFFLLLVIFVFCVSIFGEKYPILNLLNAILCLIIAAADFSAKGTDWVNTLGGLILLGVAWYWGSQYLKYRHKKL